MHRSHRWQEVKELLHSALELRPAERPAFLDRECRDDLVLRRELESLIASHDGAASLFEMPALHVLAAAVSNTQTATLAGKTLGHYEVSKKIAAGGMGEVYLARDLSLSRNVALKILPVFFTQDADRLSRFQQEARAASALNHPNILTVYEIGNADRVHYIATEFVDGETLRDRIDRGPLKISEAIDIATQAASALAAAHEAGIIHRDIKPENVMLRRDGIVKVLDFGLAKLTERPGGHDVAHAMVKTGEGIVIGTAQYMSPEQARGQELDGRTDIWSLGCVLYELIAGRAPFTGPTTSDLIVSILDRDPAPLSPRGSGLPEEIDGLIKRCLRKDRDERYQTSKDLLADLRVLMHRFEFDAEGARTALPGSRSDGGRVLDTDDRSAIETAGSRLAHPASSAEYLVTQIQRHKRGSLLVLGALILAAIAAAYVYYSPTRGSAINSMAVLPLQPLTQDEKSRSLGLGLTDTLIMKIGGLRQITVRPISAVARFADTPHDALEIGRALRVDAVLEGTIQHLDGRVRFNVRLLRVENGEQLWAEQFEGDAAQIFDLQDRLTAETAEALKLKLGSSENKQIAKRFTSNADALDAYLKGRYFSNRRTANDLRTAIGFFNEAIFKDPNYALAYAGLADAYSLLADYNGARPHEAYPKANDSVMRALELDDELAEAHTSSAYIKMSYYRDREGAETEYRRAIALNPKYATARQWYAEYLTAMGRFDEALAETQRAKEIDPLSPIINAGEVWTLYFARRCDEAIERARRIAELNPQFVEIHEYLKRCYDQKGMYAEAIAARQTRRRLVRLDATENPILKQAAAARDRKDYWEKRLRQEIEEARGEPPEFFNMAEIYAQVGEIDLAFEQLNRSIEERDYEVMYLRVAPNLDPLRADPRFADALRRAGLLF